MKEVPGTYMPLENPTRQVEMHAKTKLLEAPIMLIVTKVHVAIIERQYLSPILSLITPQSGSEKILPRKNEPMTYPTIVLVVCSSSSF